MSIKKIESLNKHENPATNTNPFNIDAYLNDNWDKVKEVVDNNADELTVAQQDITDIKAKNTEQDSRIETNENNISELQTDNETNKENISNLQSDNTTNKSNIQSLQTDNTTNKKNISDIKQEQTTQNANITKNTSDITEIKSKNATQDEEIANINKKDTAQDTNIETLTQRLNEKDNQIAELEDKVSDLNNNQIYGQSSGEYVHLSDSAKMECDIGILGNSKQETRQGYNLWNNLVGAFPGWAVEMCGVKDYTSNSITLYNKNTDKSLNCYMQNLGVSVKVKTNTDYTFIYQSDAKGGKIIGEDTVQAFIFNESNETVLKFNVYPNVPTVVNTGDNNYIKLRFDINGYEKQHKFYNIMLVEGSYTADTLPAYEQYGVMPSIDYPSEIESVSSANVKVWNKNLLKINDCTLTKNGLTLNVKDGNIHISGTSTDRTTFFMTDYTNIKEIRSKILNKTVTLTNDKPGKYEINVGVEDSMYYLQCNENKKSHTKLINKLLTGISIYIGANSTVDINTKIQLEQGTTATDYIPHEEQNYPVDMQEPFKGINDIRDCFVSKEDGKWYERHKIKHIVENGTGNWNMNIATSLFQLRLSDKGVREGGGLCNCYKYNKVQGSINANLKDGEFAIQVLDAGTFLYIKDTQFTTLESFLKKINEQNIVLDYPLATPYDLECTETQVKQLQQLAKAKTYKNITNITTDTIAVLDVDYKRDLETYQKQQDDRITAIEQLLSTTTTSAMLLDNVQSDLESEVK